MFIYSLVYDALTTTSNGETFFRDFVENLEEMFSRLYMHVSGSTCIIMHVSGSTCIIIFVSGSTFIIIFVSGSNMLSHNNVLLNYSYLTETINI